MRGRALLRAWPVAAVLAAGFGCSVGGGQGDLFGEVVAPQCGLEELDYRLSPTFFSAEVTGQQMNIRVQRGSEIEGYADGVMIQVRDIDEISNNRLGIPISVGPEMRSLVQIVVYLNQSCPSGFPDFFVMQPVIMEARSGEIVFNAIYAPDIEPGSVRIAAELNDVRFAAPDATGVIGDAPETTATLSGGFSFFYQRGSPAQRFP